MEESLSPNPSSPYAKNLQENEITQEYGTLISTLPKTQGWVFTHFYKYQGFWHGGKDLQGVLTCQRHFQAQNSDVLLTTTPKSGTTWLKAMIYSLVNRARLTKKDHDDENPFHLSNPHDLVPFLELSVFADSQVPDLSGLPSPRTFSTHLPLRSLPKSVMQTGCKIVYLCRNPKDVCISYWHFTNKLRGQEKEKISLEEAVERFCIGETLYGPFWEHVLEYWKCCLDNPDKVFFMKYEDLKTQPVLYLKKLADFIGCSFTHEEENNGVIEDILKLCSFDSLSNLEVNKSGKLSTGYEKKFFFRKGEVGDWKNYMSPKMIERIDKICEEKFLDCGLKL